MMRPDDVDEDSEIFKKPRETVESQASQSETTIREQSETTSRRQIEPPKYDNRFTRMKLNETNVVRTERGFVNFFNANSAYMLHEAWDNAEPIEIRKRKSEASDEGSESKKSKSE